MKKYWFVVLFVTVLCTGMVLLPVKASQVAGAAVTSTPAPTPKLNPDEVVADAACERAILLGSATQDGIPTCNSSCQRKILYDAPGYTTLNGHYCEYGKTDTAAKSGSSSAYCQIGQDCSKPVQPASPDTALIYLRGALYLILGASSLAVILYGLYGWYLRAMSEGNPDKVAESFKVYKNAVIGIIIVFLAVAITQMIFAFMGVTSGPFDFNFIPKGGYEVDVQDGDVGRFCYSNQKDINGAFTCDPDTNKWVKN